jgi:hypothetical protein
MRATADIVALTGYIVSTIKNYGGMNMKRITAILITLALAVSMLSACSKSADTKTESPIPSADSQISATAAPTNEDDSAVQSVDRESERREQARFLATISTPLADSVAISTVEQLIAINDNLSGHYHLTADIDLGGIEWVPIGTNESLFTGIFDGQGHVVSNLSINQNVESGDAPSLRFGLFNGICANGAIINVGLTGVNIKVTVNNMYGTLHIGSIVGVVSNATISNCYAEGVINVPFTSRTSYCGGLVGWFDGRHPSSDNMSILGYLSINDCLNAVDIEVKPTSSWLDIGGIVGDSVTGSIINCVNYGAITGNSEQDAFIGGICGAFSGSNQQTLPITGCQNFGDVSSANSVGGICGGMTFAEMSSCVNGGSVNGVFAQSPLDNIVGESKDSIIQ